MLELIFFLIYCGVANIYHVRKRADYLQAPFSIIPKAAKDTFIYGIQGSSPLLIIAGLISRFELRWPTAINQRLMLSAVLCLLGIILFYLIGKILDIVLKRYYGF